ncbi:hypothetical protein [Evansella cellulosilytica]|uniref:Uncharacterized protein n=1 Tax=Evansella cellulosilytica (strain ATCC 21833 / DSM 2522 / FERM P-1141 / JCM 9156 / N-4) TaxID=649639 RepID=E6TXS8_EVAC2|nr:hypothetical protein [Evansella cellulosilytica]ADU30004.1 hypothetical protein Bcell_1741 [Evansella cellulosilytica DSM 2522]
MEELYKEIHVYLNMEEEITFESFDRYYKKVIEYFNDHADEFQEEQLWRALFIAENVMSNANARAKENKKSSKSKKYRKIGERLTLWAQNFAARLAELGYNEQQMNERFESMFGDAEELNA